MKKSLSSIHISFFLFHSFSTPRRTTPFAALCLEDVDFKDQQDSPSSSSSVPLDRKFVRKRSRSLPGILNDPLLYQRDMLLLSIKKKVKVSVVYHYHLQKCTLNQTTSMILHTIMNKSPLVCLRTCSPTASCSLIV
jgi:hypothetical protein